MQKCFCLVFLLIRRINTQVGSALSWLLSYKARPGCCTLGWTYTSNLQSHKCRSSALLSWALVARSHKPGWEALLKTWLVHSEALVALASAQVRGVPGKLRIAKRNHNPFLLGCSWGCELFHLETPGSFPASMEQKKHRTGTFWLFTLLKGTISNIEQCSFY